MSVDVYGFGEQYNEEWRRVFDWRRLSILNQDQGPRPGANNVYGSHPFLLGLGRRSDRYEGAFGLFLNNPYPMDLQLQPGNILTYRIMGGELDFYLFNGPSPNQVVQQYLQLIGKPPLPPYWYLGFQLSRYGYTSLAKLKTVWLRNRAAKIPQDVQVTDIDYMNGKKDFTYDSQHRFHGLRQFIDSIHVRTLLIL